MEAIGPATGRRLQSPTALRDSCGKRQQSGWAGRSDHPKRRSLRTAAACFLRNFPPALPSKLLPGRTVFVNGVFQDVRFALRTLAKSPGFTLVSLLTLAIGIGANTAIFSFVDAVLLKPLPYADADRIVRVLEKPPKYPRNGISTLNYLDWVHQNTVFDYMAAQTGGNLTLTGNGEPVQLSAGLVSAHYFDIFGMKAAIGRTFAPDEDQLGKDHVVVLSHVLWETRFGGDPSLVGRTIRLDNESYTVIGVLSAGSSFDRA